MNYYNAEAFISGAVISVFIVLSVFYINREHFTSSNGILCLVVCCVLIAFIIVPPVFLILERNRIKRRGKAYDGKIICCYRPPMFFNSGLRYYRYMVEYKKGQKTMTAYFSDNSDYNKKLSDLTL